MEMLVGAIILEKRVNDTESVRLQTLTDFLTVLFSPVHGDDCVEISYKMLCHRSVSTSQFQTPSAREVSSHLAISTL